MRAVKLTAAIMDATSHEHTHARLTRFITMNEIADQRPPVILTSNMLSRARFYFGGPPHGL